MLLSSVCRQARMPRNRSLIVGAAVMTSLALTPAHTPCEGWTFPRFWRTADAHAVRECLSLGYSVDARSPVRNATPLHRAAAYSDDPEVIAVLVEAGGSLEAVSRAGRTPLHAAARNNENPEVLRALLRYEPDTYARNPIGRTPLHLAALFNDNPDVVEELARVTDVNVAARAGETPLHSATRSGTGPTVPSPNPDVVAVLLRHGADLAAEARGRDVGATPTLWADDRRVVEIIREEEVRREATRDRFLRYVATRLAVGTVALALLGYLVARLGRTGGRFAAG